MGETGIAGTAAALGSIRSDLGQSRFQEPEMWRDEVELLAELRLVFRPRIA